MSSLRYAKSHEWARDDGDGIYTIGISTHAQELLGDMVFVDLPTEDDEIEQGEDIAVVESVKAASDVYSPLKGTVIEVNEDLEDSPELINEDPYGKGWMFKVSSNSKEFEALLSEEQYQAILKDE